MTKVQIPFEVNTARPAGGRMPLCMSWLHDAGATPARWTLGSQALHGWTLDLCQDCYDNLWR